MANLWRRDPTGRILGSDLIRGISSGLGVGFFENPQTPGGANTVTIASVGEGQLIYPIVGESPDPYIDPLWASVYEIALFYGLEHPRYDTTPWLGYNDERDTFGSLFTGATCDLFGGPFGYPALVLSGQRAGQAPSYTLATSNTRTAEFYFKTTAADFALFSVKNRGVYVLGGVLKLTTSESSAEIISVAVPGISDGQWHHFAVTHTAANLFTIYIDGFSVGSVTSANTLGGYIGGGSPEVYTAPLVPRLEGSVAMWRATSDVRYTANFSPPKSYPLSAPASVTTFSISSVGASTLPIGDGDPHWDSVQILYRGSNWNGVDYFSNQTQSLAYEGIFSVGSALVAGTPFSASRLSLGCVAGGFARISGVAPEMYLNAANITVDFWCRPTVANQVVATSFNKLVFSINASSQLSVSVSGTPAAVVTGTTAISFYTWHHFEMTATPTAVYLFLDGVLQGSAARTTTIPGTNQDITFNTFTGQVHDFRVTHAARHTSNFSVATADAPTYLGAAVITSFGDGTNTLDPLASAGAGVVSLPWNGANTLAAFTSSGAGVVTSFTPSVGQNTTDAFTQVSSGAVRATGAGTSTTATFSSVGVGTTILTLTDLMMYMPYDSWDDASIYDHRFSVSPGAQLSRTRSKFGGTSITMSDTTQSAQVPLQHAGEDRYSTDYPTAVTFSSAQTHSFFVYAPTSGVTLGRLFGVNAYFGINGESSKTRELGWSVNFVSSLSLVYTDYYQPGTGYVNQTVNTGTALPRDQWVHVAVSFQSDRIRIFFDGVNVYSAARIGNGPAFPDGSHVFSFGADSYDGALRFRSGASGVFVDDYQWTNKGIASDATFVPPLTQRLLSDKYAVVSGVGSSTTAATNVGTASARTTATGSNTTSLTVSGSGTVLGTGVMPWKGTNTVVAFAQVSAGGVRVTAKSPDDVWRRTGLLVRHDKLGVNNIAYADGTYAYGFNDESPRPKGNQNSNASANYVPSDDTPFGIGKSVTTISPRAFAFVPSFGYIGVWNFAQDLCFRSGTAETWLKLSDTTGFVRLFEWKGSNLFYADYNNVTGAVSFGPSLIFGDNPYVSGPSTGAEVIPRNTWVHVALTIVYDTASSRHTVNLFVNGVKTLSATIKAQFFYQAPLANGDEEVTIAPYNGDYFNLPVSYPGSFQPYKSLQDDFRWVRQEILYTDNFTPPTQPLSVRAPETSTSQAVAPSTYMTSVGTAGVLAKGNGRVLYTSEFTSFSEQQPNSLGAGANTLAAFTSVGTASITSQSAGDGANTVTVTSAGTATVPVAGAGANATTVTSLGTAAAKVQGAGANTLAALVSVGSAGLVNLGVGANTVAPLTSSGVGVVPLAGAGANTITATSLGAGQVRVTADSATTTTALSVGAGSIKINGLGDSAFQAFLAACVGQVLIQGEGLATISDASFGEGTTTYFGTTFDGRRTLYVGPEVRSQLVQLAPRVLQVPMASTLTLSGADVRTLHVPPYSHTLIIAALGGTFTPLPAGAVVEAIA